MLTKLLVGWNKIRLRQRQKKGVASQKILLLFSHCLQRSECNQKIVNDLANCKRCGKCVVRDLLEVSERYGIKIAVASGGKMAMEKAKSLGPEVIVAIACQKELDLGIKGSWPSVVAAIPHKQPKGPCKDCVVSFPEVEKAIRKLIAGVLLRP